MVAPDRRDDRPNLGVAEHVMEIRCPLLRRRGNPTRVPQCMGADPGAKPERFDLADAAIQPALKRRAAEPRRADDPDGFAGLEGSGFDKVHAAFLIRAGILRVLVIIVPPGDR